MSWYCGVKCNLGGGVPTWRIKMSLWQENPRGKWLSRFIIYLKNTRDHDNQNWKFMFLKELREWKWSDLTDCSELRLPCLFVNLTKSSQIIVNFSLSWWVDQWYSLSSLLFLCGWSVVLFGSNYKAGDFDPYLKQGGNTTDAAHPFANVDHTGEYSIAQCDVVLWVVVKSLGSKVLSACHLELSVPQR